VILDAWSRRVVGYALGRQIDTRLTLAAIRPQSTHAILHQAWFTIPLAAHSTPRNPIGANWQRTRWSLDPALNPKRPASPP
jgi:hypothetical protein